MNQPWTRRTLLTAAAGAVAAGLSQPLLPTQAQAAPARRQGAFTVRSFTDPFAAAARTADGKSIKALAVDASGRLFVGHGDWNANIGPIDVHYLNPSTGTFSPSILSMPTESTQYLRSVDGRIIIPNADPKTYWEGGQPLALQRTDGSVSMSAWSNPVHTYDVCKLGNLGAGAYAAMGSYIDPVNGISSNAVYFTVDDGSTFKVAQHPATGLESANVQTCFWLKGALYVSAKSTLWRWNGTIPGDWSNWHDYFTPAVQNVRVLSPSNTGHHVACNGSIAVLKAAYGGTSGTFTFDGATLRQLTTPGFPHSVATTDRQGFIYVLSAQGLLRTKDGQTWWSHTVSRSLATRFPPFVSMAVDESTVWGGTTDSTIWAFASAAGSWGRVRSRRR